MTSNSLRQPVTQLMQMSFHEPMLQAPQHGGIMPSGGIVQPGSFAGQDSLLPKTLDHSGPPPNTIAMSTLIDFIVCKTYHDITVMSDILPSKTDLERKTSILEFSSRTRQLFIRLLSLVKWANSVGKVVRCSDISNFLDRQALLFVDVADKLHVLSNQLVVQARLPNFSIPAAIDVLTTGTYPRLPLCIRERIIPPDPIKKKEKNAALKRINQIMLYRLVTEFIPLQIVDISVDQGVVLLHIPNEFKAYLTLMGDGENTPWRVLKLEFLVKDLDVGSGRSLIHPTQVNYIHQLVQSRLFANEQPLKDLFDLLHTFCLSLQLEVLHAQANRLARLRWGKFIHIEEYKPGQKLSISYWKVNASKNQGTACTLVMQQSSKDPSKPLEVVHQPPLTFESGFDAEESCSYVDDLSLEYLIHRSICARSIHLLNQIKEILQKHIKHDASYFSRDDDDDQRGVLFIPLLEGWEQANCLRLLVDPQTGKLSPFMDGAENSLLEKMEKEINESHMMLVQWFHSLRLYQAKLQCKLAVQHLPVLCLDQLLVQKGSMFDENCLFVKFLRHPSYYLVVEMIPSSERPTAMLCNYHLISTTLGNSSNENCFRDHNPSSAILEIETIHVLNPVRINQKEEAEELNASTAFAQLVQVVCSCNSRLPFVSLIRQLEEKGISHQCVQEESPGLGLVCHLLTPPAIPELENEVNRLLQDATVQCSFRVVDRGSLKIWSVELLMKGPLLQTTMDKNDYGITLVCFSYDAFTATHTTARKDLLKLFLLDWSAVGQLFAIVLAFSRHFHHPTYSLNGRVKVYSYSYKSITILYGKEFSLSVTIVWTEEKNFLLRFGRFGSLYNSNAHCLVRHYLTEKFNTDPNINDLLHILVDTSAPLQALSRLPCTAVQHQKALADLLFTIVPQTPTHYRVFFLSRYCIDIYCREDGNVMIRDGAFSQFEFAKAKTRIVPVPGLASFLSKYRDSSNVRRFADSEKDNPPSPVYSQESAQNHGLLQLPHTSYSGANFTVISHAALQLLCTTLHPKTVRFPVNLQAVPCPLEQFLSSALCRSMLNKCIASTEYVNNIAMSQNADGADASLASAFVTRSLQLVCQPHPQDMLKLVIKANPAAGSQNMDNWMMDDLQTIEKFFDLRVTCSPYRHGAMTAFFNMISAPTPILKDIIQLMRIEMYGRQLPGFNPKWAMSLCLTSPPTQSVAQVGAPCVMIKDKVLIFVQLTPLVNHGLQGPPPIIVIPLLYEPPKNLLAVLSVAIKPNTSWGQEMQAVGEILRRVTEMGRPNDNSISYAVRHLMESFVIPGMNT